MRGGNGNYRIRPFGRVPNLWILLERSAFHLVGVKSKQHWVWRPVTSSGALKPSQKHSAWRGTTLRNGIEQEIGTWNVTRFGRFPCDKESCGSYKKLMDLSLFRDPVFVLFALSNFCTSIGLNIPYVYMKVIYYIWLFSFQLTVFFVNRTRRWVWRYHPRMQASLFQSSALPIR